MTPYVPVDCGFYDRVEAAIVRRQPVALVLEGGRTVTARLIDLRAQDGADWAEVDGLGLVRLDAILELGGIRRPAACAVR